SGSVRRSRLGKILSAQRTLRHLIADGASGPTVMPPCQLCCFTEVRMRLKDKIAIVIGAGQSPGEGLGNGRATVLRFAEEGAKVLAVDNNLSSAEETVAIARQAENASPLKQTSQSRRRSRRWSRR